MSAAGHRSVLRRVAFGIEVNAERERDTLEVFALPVRIIRWQLDPEASPLQFRRWVLALLGPYAAGNTTLEPVMTTCVRRTAGRRPSSDMLQVRRVTSLAGR